MAGGVAHGRRLTPDRLADFVPTRLIRQRGRAHTSYRLAVRLYDGCAAVASGSGSRRRVVAAAVCAIGDVVSGYVLTRSDRPALVPRLLIDGIDTALWSLSYDVAYDAAVLTGVPLALETGLRGDPLKALAVPLGNATLTGMIRRWRGVPFRPGAFVWQIMASLSGIGLRRYHAHQLNLIRARHRQETQAAERAARLAGQNEVAMGADSIIDLLCRTTPLFVQGDSVATGQFLRDWKANLAIRTSTGAAYLQTVLLAWQNEQNQHPDLSLTVLVDVPEGEGSVVLTAAQSASLLFTLRRMALRGIIQIRLADPNQARLPGKPLQLRVNEMTVHIEGDRSERFAPFDPGPAMFLVSAWWFLTTARSSGPSVPLRRTVPQSLLSVAGAFWAHNRINKTGDRAHAGILSVLVGLSALHTALTTRSMRRPFSPEGIRRYTSLDGLLAFVMLIPMYLDDLSSRQRNVLIASLVSVISLGIVLTPTPRKFTHWTLEAIWPLSALIASLDIGRAVDGDAFELQSKLDESSEVAIIRAFEEGRQSVVSMVREGRNSTWQHLSTAGGMPEGLRIEVLKRLEEIDQRLEKLACQNGS
jgi:hypothetical protein